MPAGFNHILGQPGAVSTLTAALASGKIHHAWIFSGPFGVGKRTAAEAFAGLLLDPTTAEREPGRFTPDAASPTQRLLAAGSHPDLHIITKELAAYHDDPQVRNRKQATIAKGVIDQHLLGPIVLAPQLPSDALAQKVFIIDEAELLDRSRTNAPTQASMLKTLEEPPPGSVVILITSSEERLLPTVRSRCQRVQFRSLGPDAMRAWFDRAELHLDTAERDWVERFASGAPGRAALAIDTKLYEWHATLDPMLADAEAGRFDPALGPAMAKLVDAWAAAQVKRGEKEGFEPSKDAANRAAAGHLFTLLGERARSALRASLSDRAAASRRLREVGVIEEAERRFSANVNPQMVFEALAAQLASPGPDPLTP